MLPFILISERLVARDIDTARLPKHVGFIPDGNRRWARAHGTAKAEGNRRGVTKIPEVLGWCEQTGIDVVTLYSLSIGNLIRAEDEALFTFLEDVVRGVVETGRWRLHPIGSLDLLPAHTRSVIDMAVERTSRNQSLLINMALAYSGRQDIVSAIHAFLRQPRLQTADAGKIAELLTVDTLDQHISTAGQPEVDLIIRTSGEQRLSGFLTWQAEQSELYFCPRFWPDFRKIDFLRALRSYNRRQRRFGT